MSTSFPITVQPGVALPVDSGTALLSSNGNSMNVQFATQSPDYDGAKILLSICILVKVGSANIEVCYTRLINANGQVELFDSMLPVNSVILSITPTYDIVKYLPI